MAERLIRLVCFDLGGVVVRICRTWEEACARAGIEVRAPERFADPAARRRRRELSDLYQSGAIECESYYRLVAETTGGLYHADEVRRVHAAWTLDDYPGIDRLITSLGSHGGVLTACLSNTNRSHWEVLRHGTPEQPPSRAVPALQHHFLSQCIGAIKPDERIYQHVERTLGFSPSEIVFFDDLSENIEAARRRGWRAHQVDHTGDTALQVRRHLVRYGVVLREA